MTTGQRQPALLRARPARRPAQHLEHRLLAAIALLAAADPGHVHGHKAGSGVQHHTEVSPQTLGSVVIEVTPHDHAGVFATTAPNGDGLLGRVIHGSPLGTPSSVYRQGPGQLLHSGKCEARHPPLTPPVT
jgi:hypothetical protein